MRFPRLLRAPLAAAVLAITSFATPAAAVPGPWQAKVDPWVLVTSATGSTEFLVFLKEQGDVRGADLLTTREAKGQFVFARLRDTAARTQGPLLALLAGRGIEHRPYWVANMI